MVPNETGSDPTYSTGVTSFVFVIIVLGVAAFVYTRNRRQKRIQPQVPNPSEKRPLSKDGLPTPSVPSIPYVGLSCGAEPGNRF